MGRSCKCCGGECRADVIHLFADRYGGNVISLVQKTEEFYSIRYKQSDGLESGDPKKLNDHKIESFYTEGGNLYIANTFRIEKESEERFNSNGSIYVDAVYKKTTIIRKLAVEFNVDDVFDWDEDFIENINLRLGNNIPTTEMDGFDDWSGSENFYIKISGILKNKALPNSLSMFAGYADDSSLIEEITDENDLKAIDIEDVLDKENATFMFLFEPLDVETKDSFWDEVDEDVLGSMAIIGSWAGNYQNSEDVDSITWLELYRKKESSTIEDGEIVNDFQSWVGSYRGNIIYDWHTCFDRVADGEYNGKCFYMDSIINFGERARSVQNSFLNGPYFEQGGSAQINIFKPKIDNTKDGARKDYLTLLYEYKFLKKKKHYEYITPEDCDCSSTSPVVREITDYVGKHLAVGVDPTNIWEFGYEVGGDKISIIRNEVFCNQSPYEEEECEIPDEVPELYFAAGVNDIYIRDCVIETTGGSVIVDEAPDYFRSTGSNYIYGRYPVYGEYSPVKINLKLINQPFYGTIRVNDIYNERTFANDECPSDFCVGGPSALLWDILFENGDLVDGSAEHNIRTYGLCGTRLTSILPREPIGGEYSINNTYIREDIEYLPTTDSVWFISGHNESSLSSRHRNDYYLGAEVNCSNTFFTPNNIYPGSPTASGGGNRKPIDLVDSPVGAWRCSEVTHVPLGGGDLWSPTTFIVIRYPADIFDPTALDTYTYYIGTNAPSAIEYGVGSFQTSNTVSIASLEDVEPLDLDDKSLYGSDYTITTVENPHFNLTSFDQYHDKVERRPFDPADVILTSDISTLDFWTPEKPNNYVFEINTKDTATWPFIKKGTQYVPGSGIRFRLSESVREDEIRLGCNISYSSSDFDILYQQWVPSIIQDGQLTEDEIGEIAGYVTDFKYWYQIKGRVFVPNDDGEEIEIIDDEIVTGDWYTDAYFYIDGSGNVSDPHSSLGFEPTPSEMAVYVDVDISFYGLNMSEDVDDGYEYSTGYPSHQYYCTKLYSDVRHTFAFNSPDYMYTQSYSGQNITTSWTYVPSEGELSCIGDYVPSLSYDSAHYTEPGTVNITSGSLDIEGRADLQSGWGTINCYEGLAELVLRPGQQSCVVTHPINVTRYSANLREGDLVTVDYQNSSRSIPGSTWDNGYSKGQQNNQSWGFSLKYVGMGAAPASLTLKYKKVVDRFSCDNLPLVDFTEDDLLWYCRSGLPSLFHEESAFSDYFYRTTSVSVKTSDREYGLYDLSDEEYEDIIDEVREIISSIDVDLKTYNSPWPLLPDGGLSGFGLDTRPILVEDLNTYQPPPSNDRLAFRYNQYGVDDTFLKARNRFDELNISGYFRAAYDYRFNDGFSDVNAIGFSHNWEDNIRQIDEDCDDYYYPCCQYGFEGETLPDPVEIISECPYRDSEGSQNEIQSPPGGLIGFYSLQRVASSVSPPVHSFTIGKEQ